VFIEKEAKMKKVFVIVASLLLFGFTQAEDDTEASEQECRAGFLILEEKIFTGCQVSANEYWYIDYEQQGHITGPLDVVDIVYPGDEEFSRLESLMNLGRYEGLLMGVPGMQVAAQMGRRIGQAEGYAAGRRDALQQGVVAPAQCGGIDL
tara:strand:- start:438877 stop:439326 length:450 start_codon:yes stop_codon:yes gene_type:complete